MKSALARALLVGLLLLAPPRPLHAVPPPPPAHGIYGPATQCFEGYRIAAGEAEAIVLQGGILSLYSQTFLIALRNHYPPLHRRRERVREIDVPALGRVTRFDLPARRAQFYFEADQARSTEYLLPAVGQYPVMVVSPAFNGSAGDLAILARIARVDPARDRCGTFAHPDYAGEDPEADTWTPIRHRAPHFRCQQGLGFALAAGEEMRLRWPHDNWSPVQSRLTDGDALITVTGALAPPARRRGAATGPVAAGYRETRIDRPGFHVLTLSPPARMIGRSAAARYEIAIQYSGGGEAAARQLARRLAFVDANDPRCRAG